MRTKRFSGGLSTILVGDDHVIEYGLCTVIQGLRLKDKAEEILLCDGGRVIHVVVFSEDDGQSPFGFERGTYTAEWIDKSAAGDLLASWGIERDVLDDLPDTRSLSS